MDIALALVLSMYSTGEIECLNTQVDQDAQRIHHILEALDGVHEHIKENIPNICDYYWGANDTYLKLDSDMLCRSKSKKNWKCIATE